MNDPRCSVGLHAYREPDKDHPVPDGFIGFHDEAHDGRLMVVCQRCRKTKTDHVESRSGSWTRRGWSDGERWGGGVNPGLN